MEVGQPLLLKAVPREIVGLPLEAYARTPHQLRVDRFMTFAGQNLPRVPVPAPYEVRKLRATLVLEEALELVAALGFSVYVNPTKGSEPGDPVFDEVTDEHRIRFLANRQPDMVKIVDGCCDVSVVTTGTLSAFGVPDSEFLLAVDVNNLQKFGPGSFRREDGKWVKPEGHKPPDIAALLQKVQNNSFIPAS